MKAFHTRPPWYSLLQSLPPELQGKAFRDVQAARAADSRYLHWEDFRFRPAPEGHTVDSWWLATKLARSSRWVDVPLLDKAGAPFRFGLPDGLMALLHRIDRHLGFTPERPGGTLSSQQKNAFTISALMQESITSSQLEGAATTREVAKEMLRSKRPPRDTSERMILNNYQTMQHLRTLRQQDLQPGMVLELHTRITQGTLEKVDATGRLRLPEEDIHVEDNDGNILHTPPPADQLPGRLAQMCTFANGQTSEPFIHPVIRAILLHFWLAYDHPFVDGNGRTARALFYWAMLRAGYDLFEYISISHILLEAPTQYGLAFLHTETDDNDLTYFILHQAAVIEKAVEALHAYIARKTRENQEAAQSLRGLEGLNHRQQALLAHALREPGQRYLIRSHERSHKVSFQTARNDLFDLRTRGLLLSRKEGRSQVFYAPSDLSDKLARLATPPEAIAVPDDQTAPLPFGNG